MRAPLLLAVAALFACTASSQPNQAATQPVPPHAPDRPQDRLFHDQMIVLDTHLDIPERFFVNGWDFGDRHSFEQDHSQVDLPRMDQGGLDGGFFVIYTRQGELTPAGYGGARNQALERAAAIQRMMTAHSDRITLVTTPDEADRAAAAGRHFAFMSIENSWPLGEDVSLLETFHRFGVRMAGPVHSRNNQLADSATDTPRWNGFSPLGRQWVTEMNRLGMIIDCSHSSNDVFDQMLQLSRAPIVCSHSGPRVIYDHRRNLDDDRMRRLARAGGLMMINSVFLGDNDFSDARSALEDRQKRWAQLTPAERRRLLDDIAAQDARTPWTNATFEAYIRSILHAVRIMGADHVGLGADWDGGGGLADMNDITGLPRITARLRREGLSDRDIANIMGGNLLRVMRQVQAAAGR